MSEDASRRAAPARSRRAGIPHPQPAVPAPSWATAQHIAADAVCHVPHGHPIAVCTGGPPCRLLGPLTVPSGAPADPACGIHTTHPTHLHAPPHTHAPQQIPPEERRGIPHHLLDVLDPSDDFSAGDFYVAARRAAEDILQVGTQPSRAGCPLSGAERATGTTTALAPAPARLLRCRRGWLPSSAYACL